MFWKNYHEKGVEIDIRTDDSDSISCNFVKLLKHGNGIQYTEDNPLVVAVNKFLIIACDAVFSFSTVAARCIT